MKEKFNLNADITKYNIKRLIALNFITITEGYVFINQNIIYINVIYLFMFKGQLCCNKRKFRCSFVRLF